MSMKLSTFIKNYMIREIKNNIIYYYLKNDIVLSEATFFNKTFGNVHIKQKYVIFNIFFKKERYWEMYLTISVITTKYEDIEQCILLFNNIKNNDLIEVNWHKTAKFNISKFINENIIKNEKDSVERIRIQNKDLLKGFITTNIIYVKAENSHEINRYRIAVNENNRIIINQLIPKKEEFNLIETAFYCLKHPSPMIVANPYQHAEEHFLNKLIKTTIKKQNIPIKELKKIESKKIKEPYWYSQVKNKFYRKIRKKYESYEEFVNSIKEDKEKETAIDIINTLIDCLEEEYKISKFDQVYSNPEILEKELIKLNMYLIKNHNCYIMQKDLVSSEQSENYMLFSDIGEPRNQLNALLKEGIILFQGSEIALFYINPEDQDYTIKELAEKLSRNEHIIDYQSYEREITDQMKNKIIKFLNLIRSTNKDGKRYCVLRFDNINIYHEIFLANNQTNEEFKEILVKNKLFSNDIQVI